MASIKGFFDKLSSAKQARFGQKVTPDILEQLFPIRNLSEEIRQSFASETHVELIDGGTTLFTVNSQADCAIYLIFGSIQLTDQNGRSYNIEAGSAQAKFPICSGSKHTTTAVAQSDIGILRVSLKIMSTRNRFQHRALEIPENLRDNRLLALFADHFQNHELDIPSLPEVAIKLRKAIQKDVNLDVAVNIIQLDPVISAKLIEVANCPLYLTVVPAKNCLEAVNRIGLTATRNLVIALSLKQIFKSKSHSIKQRLETLWKQSLYLSALCHVLAASSQQAKPEDALLAGLVCDIGSIPFLNFVANLPDEFIIESEIEQALPLVVAPLSATVLREWQFADEFVDVALNSRNWYENLGEEFSLTDVVVLSRLHALIGNKNNSELPAITAIPAASKLKGIALSPENTLSILHDAKHKIHEALAIFNS
ncbi:HDOD domain-containing protein [Methylomonas sp. SURF-2]|uniref:HDOD domain-containing protein n=1 Tax=Methylomonas subterranea TaxID=2952225 RepID=A0ABT1TDI1_9GAMM|nr:HDOD domain-containing protein [Methylomonas sp. SURF-2]MCQ8103338.1 HDOD domain-containing protein [Methylomonas sp. SURF-2]